MAHPQFRAVLRLVGRDAAVLQRNDGTLKIEPVSAEARQRIIERASEHRIAIQWSQGYGVIA